MHHDGDMTAGTLLRDCCSAEVWLRCWQLEVRDAQTYLNRVGRDAGASAMFGLLVE